MAGNKKIDGGQLFSAYYDANVNLVPTYADEAEEAFVDTSMLNRYKSNSYYTTVNSGAVKSQSGSKNLKKIIAAAATLFLIMAFLFAAWVIIAPIHVTINDTEVTLYQSKSIVGAIEAANLTIHPGNLIDIEGDIIEEGKGESYDCTYNGKHIGKKMHLLGDGDVLQVRDGKDIEEPSHEITRTVPPAEREAGVGSIRIITEGHEGTERLKVGDISQKEAVLETIGAQDKIYLHTLVDVHGEKVVALTFDDGPWPDTTDQILDILKEYNIKATFFVVGNQVHDAGAESVKRAHAEGHQICTHSYSHASSSGQGVNLGYMSSEERIAEIQKGLDAIADATGKPASSVIRAPGGNFSLDVWKDVEGLVSAEIGWDIDTRDWSKPGTSSILSSLKAVTPGDIVLMHDGGGDRSQTIAALKEALPYLIEQGYTFVTIDELLEYGFVEKEISNDTN